METLKSLFEKKQYQLIIDLKSNSRNVEDLPYLVNSYIAIGKINEAINAFETNLSNYFVSLPLYTVTTYFDLLFHVGDKTKIRKMINIFKDYPYISQEIEEIIQNYENQIFKDAKSKSKLDIDEIFEKIQNCDSELEKLNYIHMLNDYNIQDYVQDIVEIIKSGVSDYLKVFALLLLVNKRIDAKFSFQTSRKTYNVDVLKLYVPFVDKFYEKVTLYIESFAHNPSLSGVCIELFNQFILAIYPDKVEEFNDDYILICLALLYLGSKYLKIEFEKTLIDGTGYSLAQIEELVGEIEHILSSCQLNLKN